MNKKYESEALMVSHQSAQELFELGIIDEVRMREFDDLCLAPDTESALKISTKRGKKLASAEA
jgi:DNA-binding transcriptional regulator YiaG